MKINVGPKKSLGQNFLIEPRIYEDIIKTLDIKKDENILEIGAGMGTLTDYLLDASGDNGQIVAIEKDNNFVKVLSDRFRLENNVKIVHEDILRFDPAKYKILNTGYKIVGNIPYYITSRLLKTIFEEWPRPETIVLMVQKEVAQRIIAKPPKSNLLAVSVQYFAEPKIIRTVGKNNFWPAPEVDSAIIKLSVKEKTKNEKYDKEFFKILKAGFNNKRKQLINSLASSLQIDKILLSKILKSAGIDPLRRAETLTISEWEKLTKTYFSPR